MKKESYQEVDLCGRSCETVIGQGRRYWRRSEMCSHNWEFRCSGVDPPEGFNAQSMLYDLCPNHCSGFLTYLIKLIYHFNENDEILDI